MKILRASEDYLETMLMMKEKHGYIRSIDVASYLGVTKPSVSYATKRLRENGYITIAVKSFPVIETIFWAYPITWSASCVVFLIYYLKADWVHTFDRGV